MPHESDIFLRTPQRRVHLWAIELKRKKHLDKRASWLWDYQMCPLWYAGSCEWSWEETLAGWWSLQRVSSALDLSHLSKPAHHTGGFSSSLSSDEPSDRCQEPARFIEGAKQRSGETENKSIIPGETHISTGETEESADLDRVCRGCQSQSPNTRRVQIDLMWLHRYYLSWTELDDDITECGTANLLTLLNWAKKQS